MPKVTANQLNETDPDQGLYRGRRIARRYESPDGMTVLVGKTARDNDLLTFKLSSAVDFWLHVKSQSGSHVVIRNPANLDRPPRQTERFAARLAARFSGARKAATAVVSIARRSEIRKPRGAPAGTVSLRRCRTLRITAHGTDEP